MTESELTSKTPQELFGLEGMLLERKGVKKVFRVAKDMDYIRRKATEKGLNVEAMWTNRDMGTYFIVYSEVQTLDITEDPNEGNVWIADIEFERFRDLIGIDQRVVEVS